MFNTSNAVNRPDRTAGRINELLMVVHEVWNIHINRPDELRDNDLDLP